MNSAGIADKAQHIRCRGDLSLFRALQGDPEVLRTSEAIARLEKKGHLGVRRRLLATSVRLSPGMAPDVHAMKDHCAARLGLTIPLELYVYSSPQFNAACVKPEDGRLFIMFSSSLLQAFRGNELRFVVGHELGHHLYGHHDIPIGQILSGGSRPGHRLALQLFAWSRYAEISADRAGAYCAEDPVAVARALFRLASGLGDDIVHFDLDDFVRQVDDMQLADAAPGGGPAREDWFSTHPFSPLRVKALTLFHESQHVAAGGNPVDELELGVQGLMGLMEPSYLDGRTEVAEAMRRLLFAGAIAVSRADGEITEAEIGVFEEFFGDGSFSDRLDLGRILGDLPERISQVRRQASSAQCMQVLRDLCLMLVDGDDADDAERGVIYSIAEGLNVSPLFVDAQLKAIVELD